MSIVADDLRDLLLCDNSFFKLPFKILEVCFRHQEARWIWALRLTISSWFLPNIVNHILSWRWENVIQRMVAAATRHRCLGTGCAASVLATISHAEKGSIAWIHCRLYPSGRKIVIEDWGNITSIWATVFIQLLLAAPKLSAFLAVVWQTSDYHIHYG